jgi:hypothetical protein
MTDYYHCTNKTAADSIRKTGFRSAPSKEDIAYMFQSFQKYFPEEEVRAADKLYSTTNEMPRLDAISKLWTRRFGHGTPIWLSEEPAIDYGDYCFKFTPPKGTLIVSEAHEDDYYYLAWAPMKPIPRKYFKLVSVE